MRFLYPLACVAWRWVTAAMVSLPFALTLCAVPPSCRHAFPIAFEYNACSRGTLPPKALNSQKIRSAVFQTGIPCCSLIQPPLTQQQHSAGKIQIQASGSISVCRNLIRPDPVQCTPPHAMERHPLSVGTVRRSANHP